MGRSLYGRRERERGGRIWGEGRRSLFTRGSDCARPAQRNADGLTQLPHRNAPTPTAARTHTHHHSYTPQRGGAPLAAGGHLLPCLFVWYCMGTLLTHTPSTKYCTLALYRRFLDFIRTVYLPASSPIMVFSITRPFAALDQVLARNPLVLSAIPVDSPCKKHQKKTLPCF